MAAPSHKVFKSKASNIGSAVKFYVKAALLLNLIVYSFLTYRYGIKVSSWNFAAKDLWDGYLLESFFKDGVLPAFPWQAVFSPENLLHYFVYPLPINMLLSGILLWALGRTTGSKFKRDYKVLSVEQYNSDLESWKKRVEKKFEDVSTQKQDFRELNELGYATKEYKRDIIYNKPLVIDSKEGGAIIPHAMYRTHIGLMGTTQTGKSTLIRNLLTQTRGHGFSAVVIDYNGDYYKKFANEEDIILCPFIQGSDSHDMHHEPVLAEYLARSLVENESRHNKYFSDWGIALLSDLISMSQDYDDLDRLVRLDFSQMKPLLAGKGCMAKSVFESDKTAGSVVSTMQRNLKLMRHLNNFTRSAENPFSLVEWAEKCHRNWVFIVIPEEYQEILTPWVRVWVDLIVTGCMKRTQRPDFHTFLVGDEINRLGYIPSIATSATNLAKYGLSLILGFQGDSQIQKEYQEKAEEILLNLNARGIFNPGKSKKALQGAADILGTEDILEYSTSQTVSEKSSHTIGERNRDEKHIVAMNELSRLEEVECYLKASFMRPVKLTVKPNKISQSDRKLEIKVPTDLLTGYQQGKLG